MRRFLLAFLCAAFPLALHSAGAPEVHALIRAAIGQPPAGPLADYANSAGDDLARYESFVEAARRIVAGGAAARQSPDITALQLNRLAETLLRSTAPSDLIAGYLARFHARRAVAAVRYNLFQRSLRLAELVAATYGEKEAVAAWRDIVTVAELAQHPAAATFRRELKLLEASLKDLEEQCCPPDEAILKQPVWQPATALPKPE